MGTGFIDYLFSITIMLLTWAGAPELIGGYVRGGGGKVGGAGGCLTTCWKVYCILNSITFCLLLTI